MSSKSVICFDTSKNERFQLNENYKTVQRKLQRLWTVEQNTEELTQVKLEHIKLLVLAGPQERFTVEEFEALKQFIDNGGSLWILLGDGGELEFNTNVNYFLEQYGIYINNDSVVRPHYYRSFHPKECFIGGGVVCESMCRYLLEQNIDILDFDFSTEKYKLFFLYPYGATLNTSEPANVLLTSGPVVYPFNRPLAGYYSNDKGGKILAIGSAYMFHDKYLSTCKTNESILDFIINMLVKDEINLSDLDFNNIELYDQSAFTDIEFLGNIPKTCLIDPLGSDRTTDFKNLFHTNWCGFSNHLLKDIINNYNQLNIKFQPLQIIKPEFEIPLPALQLATFPPIFSEPTPPPLELYNLDEVFSLPRTQLFNMTGQCLQTVRAKNAWKLPTQKELENYIKECGHITGLLTEHSDLTACDILNISLKRIINYRPFE